jgi:hypothetical protein
MKTHFLRNVGNHSPNDAVSHSRTQDFSTTPPWKPQNSHAHTRPFIQHRDYTVSIKLAGTLADLYQTADIITWPITCATNRQLSYRATSIFHRAVLQRRCAFVLQDAKADPLQIIPVELPLCTLLSECNSGLKLIKTCLNKTSGKVCVSKYMLRTF